MFFSSRHTALHDSAIYLDLWNACKSRYRFEISCFLIARMVFNPVDKFNLAPRMKYSAASGGELDLSPANCDPLRAYPKPC